MNEISTRAKDLLDAHPVETKYDVHIVDESLNLLQIHCSIQDEKLSAWALEYPKDQLEQAALLSGGMALIEKIGLAHIFSLSFREVESFLRDENQSKAWETITEHQKFFRQFLDSLIKGVCSSLFMKQGVDLNDWADLELKDRLLACKGITEKVSFAMNIFNLGPVELVNIEEGEIILNFNPQLLDSKYFETLLLVINEYFQFSLCSSEIKLVAQ